MDNPKGFLAYNPSQSFVLHVFWIVRSPKSAQEMIEKGFVPCSLATARDTPTTLSYAFRISRNQKRALKYKEEINLIGQHPHYKAAFKNLGMGISREEVVKRLGAIQVDPTPLDWGVDGEIKGNEELLDFDPVVLECTEIYLDNRSFYEHVLSRDWMKSSAEILKPNRSLLAKTYCVGNPSQEIWSTSLETHLKAIRFDNEQNSEIIGKIRSGVFFKLHDSVPFQLDGDGKFEEMYLEVDCAVHLDNLVDLRSSFDEIQKQMEARAMIVFPTNLDQDSEIIVDNIEKVDLRLMIIVESKLSLTECKSLNHAKSLCSEFSGRLLISSCSLTEKMQEFLSKSGLSSAEIAIDSIENEISAKRFAGYFIHPLVSKLFPDSSINFKL
jgi:hypothetical protein